MALPLAAAGKAVVAKGAKSAAKGAAKKAVKKKSSGILGGIFKILFGIFLMITGGIGNMSSIVLMFLGIGFLTAAFSMGSMTIGIILILWGFIQIIVGIIRKTKNVSK